MRRGSSGELTRGDAPMAVGSLALACLLVAAQPGAADVWHMKQTRFSIPIKINPERRADIKELLLYASRDHGQTWDRVGSCTPDKESFPFFAQGDGSYWFSVAIVDQAGQQEPRDPKTGPVGQKLIVDTTKPAARIHSVERQGDEVVVHYEVRDEYLDPSSLKLEYQATNGLAGQPTPVAIVPGPGGPSQARFRPGNGGALVVRLSVKDQAGNEGTAQQNLAPTAMQNTLVSNPGPAPIGPGPVPPPGGSSSQVQPLPSPALPPSMGDPIVRNQAYAPQPGPLEPNPNPTPQPQPLTTMQPTPPAPTPLALSQSGTGYPVQEAPVSPRPLAQSGGLTQVSTVGTLPRDRTDINRLVEITNKREMKIDFEVAKYGPSGLGDVEVYMTADEGRTWVPSQGDHKVHLPGPGESKPGGGPVLGSVVVQLPSEGVVYGITLVVKSKAGLSKKPPQPGDRPQMRVELDTKQPDAELYRPEPDPTRRDALVMLWKASDKNLTANPITLEWAPALAGPWTQIGAPELPNTGRQSWVVPANIPPKVYLRLTVRDAAGNSSLAQTQEPVTVDLSIPEVTIIRHQQEPN